MEEKPMKLFLNVLSGIASIVALMWALSPLTDLRFWVAVGSVFVVIYTARSDAVYGQKRKARR